MALPAGFGFEMATNVSHALGVLPGHHSASCWLEDSGYSPPPPLPKLQLNQKAEIRAVTEPPGGHDGSPAE